MAEHPSGNSATPPTAASASGATVGSNDSLLAKRMVVLDQLTTVYGFDAMVANAALDAVGQPDVNLCYNYILDQCLAEDKGGPVFPIHTCPHVMYRVRITEDQLPSNPADTKCQHPATVPTVNPSPTNSGGGGLKGEIDADESCPGTENWLCLTCGALRCSRYVNGHGLQHWQDTQKAEVAAAVNNNKEEEGTNDGHCVAVSLSDLSVWCHICNAYVVNDQHLGGILQKLEKRKFPTAFAPKAPPIEEPHAKRHRAGSTGNGAEHAKERSDEEKMSTDKEESFAGVEDSNRDPSDVPRNHNEDADDDDEINGNDDEEDGRSFDGDESVLFQLLAEAARSQGIPLSLLMSQIHGYPIEEDTGPVEYPFDNLPRTLPEVAQFVLSDKCRRILVLAGAGMSVASGIPDFRSADGLYATLQVSRLTCTTEEQREMIREDPSAALDQHLFLENPLPCLESQREFILGTHTRRWKATLAHCFVELLHQKTGKLVRLYTQNIDGLEDQCTTLPSDKVICVHGSMDRAECARCETSQDFNQFCQSVQTQIKDLTQQDASAPSTSTPILCENCHTPSVKPAIVLFRSSLPKIFFEKVPDDVKDIDLLIVVGTSLKVAPANSLVWRVPRSAMRLLVNREPVGEHLGMDFGEESERDFFVEGDIETSLLDLIEELGWLGDLRGLLDGNLPESSDELLRARLDTAQNAATANQTEAQASENN